MSKTRDFIKELFELYDKYGFSIGHEDSHGSFKLEKNNKYNKKWMEDSLLFYEDLEKEK